jgi:ribosome-binding factor A
MSPAPVARVSAPTGGPLPSLSRTHFSILFPVTNRPRRVAELMKHELADILRKDFEFGGALVTIHEVDLTPDFKQAHVYLGIIGREDYQADAVHKLNRAARAISQKLSKRVILKNTPALHFKHDDSVERGVRILGIIEQIDEQVAPDEPPYPAAREPKVPQPKPKSKKSGRPIREFPPDDESDDGDL